MSQLNIKNETEYVQPEISIYQVIKLPHFWEKNYVLIKLNQVSFQATSGKKKQNFKNMFSIFCCFL